MAISIVIPSYNRPRMLVRLLNSIAVQTYKDFEVIVINDNSKGLEQYEQVINEYRERIPNLIYEINKVNYGAPYCRNRGIELSKNDYIAFVDDDDEWLPEKLEMQIERLNEVNSKVGLIYTWTYVADKGKLYENVYCSKIEGYQKQEILRNCFIPSPSVIVKKEVFKKVGLFDLNFPSCQDWEMWTRILLAGYSCIVVPKYLTIYHKHNESSIGLSKNAHMGYRMYYQKYWVSIIKNLKTEGITILIRHFYGCLLRMKHF